MLWLAHFTSLTVDYGTAHSLEDMWYSVTPEPIAKEQARKACGIGHSWVARFRGVLSRALECSPPLRHIAFKPAQYLSGDSSLQHGIAAHSHQSVPRDMGRQRLCDSSRKNRDEGWLQKLL